MKMGSSIGVKQNNSEGISFYNFYYSTINIKMQRWRDPIFASLAGKSLPFTQSKEESWRDYKTLLCFFIITLLYKKINPAYIDRALSRT